MAGRDEEHKQQNEQGEGVRRVSSIAQRRRWRQRAVWLSQLGLAPGDDVPAEAVEEVADAVVTLLDELEELEAGLSGSRIAPTQRPRPGPLS